MISLERLKLESSNFACR